MANISKMFRRILRGEGGEASATKALYQAAMEAGATADTKGDELAIEEAFLKLTPEELEGLHLILLEEQHRYDDWLGKLSE